MTQDARLSDAHALSPDAWCHSVVQGDRPAAAVLSVLLAQADAAGMSVAQVAASVQLDEVLRTYDRETREAFMQGAIDNAIASRGRGA